MAKRKGPKAYPGRRPPHQYPTHYPGRQWARDMNLWAAEVRENIKELEDRVAALDGKQAFQGTAYKTANWPWP